MDKLRADLDEALTSKLGLKNRDTSDEDQVILLQCQILELQTKAKEVQAASTRVIELEAELKVTVAQGGEIFVQG